MLNKCSSFAVGYVLTLFLAQLSAADLVVGYDAQDTAGDLTAIDGTGVSGSTLTRGTGINFAASGSGQDFNSSMWTNSSTPDPTHSWNFSFTSSIAYDLTSLQVRASSSNVGPMLLRLEIDTGSGFVQQDGDQMLSTTAMDIVFNFNLSAITSAAVRVLGFDASNSGVNSQLAILDDGNYFGTADVALNGVVAVPEPQAVLCGSVLCAVIGLAVGGKRLFDVAQSCTKA
jgi:hypothetical protein